MDKYTEHLLSLKQGQETIVIIKGKAFLIMLATDDDIERVSKGFFVMD